KTFVLHPGRYDIELDYDVNNQTASDWQGASYVQFARRIYSRKRSMFDVESYSYRGPAIRHGNRPQKLDVNDEEDAKFSAPRVDGRMAGMEPPFVAAAVPAAGEKNDYPLRREGGHSVNRYRGSLKSIGAGSSGRFTEKIFVGPKLQQQLKTVGPKLEKTA